MVGEPAEPASGARSVPGSYVLVGVLVSCVAVLGVALTLEMRNAAERERDLAVTRRLSEEMIALMKETRREAAKPVVSPPAVEADTSVEPSPGEVSLASPPEFSESPAANADLRSETVADTPAGEAGAPPEAAPEVASPPDASAASSTSAEADGASGSVAPASLAILGVEASPAPEPQAASAAPAPAIAAAAGPAPEPPSVARPAPPGSVAVTAAPAPPASAPVERATAEGTAGRVGVARLEAAKPPKKAPRTVDAVDGGIETRRPPAAAKAPEKPANDDPEPASVGHASRPAESKSPSAEPATAFPGLVSPRPAVENAALPKAQPNPPLQQRRTALVSPWTKLERGMSHEQVRNLLGEPRSTERLMTGEFWFYAERSIFGRGWVAFSNGGAVIEWLPL